MKPEQDICPFGLMNVVAPIIYNDEPLGYFFFGQMKTLPHFAEPDSSFMKYSLDRGETWFFCGGTSVQIGDVDGSVMIKDIGTATTAPSSVQVIGSN